MALTTSIYFIIIVAYCYFHTSVYALILSSAVLKVSYDGGHFFGWKTTNDGTVTTTFEEKFNSMETSSSRRQKPLVVRSVVGVLKKALAKIYGDVDISRVHVEGSSRTDRGVHAHGMIALVYCITEDAMQNTITNYTHDSAHFLPLPFHGDLDQLVFVLNRMLPHDVRIMDVSTVPRTSLTYCTQCRLFNPSTDALYKTYQYTVSIGRMHDPLRCRHVWHVDDVHGDFNLTNAQLCCQLFLGTHDFDAFRGRDPSTSKKYEDTTRTLLTFQMIQSPNQVARVVDGLLTPSSTITNPSLQTFTSTFQILITGNRFMYKMVRILVGAVIAVGMGKETLSSVHESLVSKTDQHRYKFCAPAHGLALLNVTYPDNIGFSWIKRR